MTVTAHTVQDDTNYVEVGIKLLESQHLGSHAPGDLGSVGDENHWCAEKFGQLGS